MFQIRDATCSNGFLKNWYPCRGTKLEEAWYDRYHSWSHAPGIGWENLAWYEYGHLANSTCEPSVENKNTDDGQPWKTFPDPVQMKIYIMRHRKLKIYKMLHDDVWKL